MEDSMLEPCVAWQEKLAALHPDDLSPVERAALNEHMVGCPACTAAFADYKKMDSLIREVFVSDSPLELPEWLTQDDLAARLPPLPRLYQKRKKRSKVFIQGKRNCRYDPGIPNLP